MRGEVRRQTQGGHQSTPLDCSDKLIQLSVRNETSDKKRGILVTTLFLTKGRSCYRVSRLFLGRVNGTGDLLHPKNALKHPVFCHPLEFCCLLFLKHENGYRVIASFGPLKMTS